MARKEVNGKWNGFTASFSKIADNEKIDAATFMELREKYNELGKPIKVKHRYYNMIGEVIGFLLDYATDLMILRIKRDNGTLAFWESEHCKITNRPVKRRKKKKTVETKKKKKAIPKKVVACEEHPNYGGIRKPRTDCKQCWALYNANKKGG